VDTAEFLRLVWPDGSNFFVAELTKTGMRHYSVRDAEHAAKKISKLNSRPSNIYYAMASFKASQYIDAKGNPRQRTQENVAQLKCFWVDLDCKGKRTDYATQHDAISDIIRLCDTTGHPPPTAVVNSGYGIHAYWVLDSAIGADEWRTVARRWRATLDAHDVKHDASCTTDSARILRPIGTMNRKDSQDDKEVKLIGTTHPIISLKTFTEHLSGSLTPDLPSINSQFAGADLSLNDAASKSVEYAESSIREIVKECGLLRAVGSVGGNVSEPLWHKTLGVVRYTTEGDKAIHIFSRGHPDYTLEDTEAKSAAWNADGPPSCEVLRRESTLEMPEHCRSCKHFGSIKGPVSLGYTKTILVERSQVTSVVGTEEKLVEVALLPPSMGNKFKWDNGKLWRCVLDKEESKGKDAGVFEWIAFCDFLFYPSSYYTDAATKQQVVWTLREREGRYKEFEISGGAIGAGGMTLMRELGEQGVTAIVGGKNHMEAYIAHWGNELKKSKLAIATYPHFGWHKDSFLLGEMLFKPDGTEERVRIGGDAAAMVKYLTPTGSADRWTALIDAAYNHKGMEQYQFILGAGFGSVLMPFMGVAGGLTLSAISYTTGQGKTTAMRNAFSIYGCPDENTPVTLSRSSVTHKGIFAVAGLLHNLPVLVDEMTNIDGKELSDIVYTWSQGQPRIRLTSTGELAPVGFGWSGLLLSSSNKPMTSIIASSKPGADAELARLIEFDCASAHKLEKVLADEIFRELRQHYGHAGVVFVKYVVANQAEVKRLLVETQTLLDRKLSLTGDKRFWSAGYVAVLVGLTIAKRLGLHQFDMAALMTWVVRHHYEMCGEILANVSTPEECFGMMINDLSPGIMVTDIEGGRGTGGREAFVIKEPRAPYTGRAILNTGVGYLSQPALLDWCCKRQIDPKATINAGVAQGWVLNKGISEKRYPGKGSNHAMGQVRCFILDWAKLENSTNVSPMLAEVVKLCNKGGG